MDAEELDYSDEDLKGDDLNTEEENSLLEIANDNDPNKAELNEYLELDCPEDYQDDENCSMQTDQNNATAEDQDKGPAQIGISPQNQNQSQNQTQNQRNNPKTNTRQSRNKNFNQNYKNNKNFNNMKQNNGNQFQQRNRSRSRSGSRPRNRPPNFINNQNRDFPVRNQENETKQFHGNPWMPDKDPNIIQNANPLLPQRTAFPTSATREITQRALNQGQIQDSVPTIQQVIKSLQVQQAIKQATAIITGGTANIPLPVNEISPTVMERAVGFNNPNQKSLLGPAPGVCLTYNSPLGNRTAISEIPSLIDTSLQRPRRDCLLRNSVNNTPAFNQASFQRTNEHRSYAAVTSNPDGFRNASVNSSNAKAFMETDLRGKNYQMPVASNLSSFDVSLKSFDPRAQNHLNQNNSGSAKPNIQVTRSNTNFPGDRRFGFPSRFVTEPGRNDYDYEEDYNIRSNSNFQTNNNGNSNSIPNRSNITANHSNNNNFRRNSRYGLNHFKGNDHIPRNQNSNEFNNRIDDFENDGRSIEGGNRPNNFRRDQQFKKTKRYSPRRPNNEEQKPPAAAAVPKITPEDKELVNQKKAERLQRFQNQSLVNYEVSSQSSAEFTFDHGDQGDFDSLEIDEEYLKGIEEQKKKREELFKLKRLKRKSNDDASLPDTTETKPVKKPYIPKTEALGQKRNPFGESEMEMVPTDIKREEEEVTSSYNGFFSSNRGNQMTRSLSTRSMEEVGLGSNSGSQNQPPRERCKSPYLGNRNLPDERRNVPDERRNFPDERRNFPDERRNFADERVPRAKSPHPGRCKTPQPTVMEPVQQAPRAKSPFPFGNAASRSSNEVPRPKSPYPRSVTPKFVLTEDMMPITKTIYNEYAHSHHGSDVSPNQSHFVDKQKEPESVFTGSIVKILNFPPSLTLDDLRKMCSPFGKTLEVKLNSPIENSAGIRFEGASSAKAFYNRYHRDNIEGNFLDVIII